MHLNIPDVVFLFHRLALLFFNLCHKAKPRINVVRRRKRDRMLEGGIIQDAGKNQDRHKSTESAEF